MSFAERDRRPMDGASNVERLRRLLGGPQLAGLRQRLRARYERGAAGVAFTLTRLTPLERRALAGLLGRTLKVGDSMRVQAAHLDEAIARAGLASDLRAALELLDGPVHDRRAQRLAAEHTWQAMLACVAQPQLAALLSNAVGAGLLKRLCGSDPALATTLLSQAQRVLMKLPGRGISLARLAAEALGDSHGLDAGRPVATLVLRAWGSGASLDSPPDSPGRPSDACGSTREQWARLGVTINELALPALCLNLPVRGNANGDGPSASSTASSIVALAGTLARGLAAPGEPVHLSLRRLLRRPPSWDAVGRDVFVCENPNVVAIAADQLGATCAPLVCTDGMPAAAQQTLLTQLAAAGARLRYHGDFDWPGLSIGNFVMREFAAEPWRFGAADYLGACAGGTLTLPAQDRVEARWDDRLTAAMAQQALAVHEEALVETLLADLVIGPANKA